MDQSMILDDKMIGSGPNSMIGDEHVDELDMHSTFVMHHEIMDGKNSPLMDLEKPIINITVENLSNNTSLHTNCSLWVACDQRGLSIQAWNATQVTTFNSLSYYQFSRIQF